MKVIVFDKDGVLIDSVKEVFHEAVVAYPAVAENELNFKKFRALYPFAKKAEDLYAIMKIVEDGTPARDITLLERHDTKGASRFRDRFYAARHALVCHEYAAWLRMIRPFGFAVQACNRLARQYRIFISTAADRETALIQVKTFAIDVQEDRILTKELSPDKEKHFNYIKEVFKVQFSDMLFIDNSLEQLKVAQKTGVAPALASWGSNAYQKRETKKLGMPALRTLHLESQIKRLL